MNSIPIIIMVAFNFFFRICITLRQEGQQEEIKECILSYVKWMCFKSPEIDKLSISNQFYEQDRIIISPRRIEGQCTLVQAGKGSSFMFLSFLDNELYISCMM